MRILSFDVSGADCLIAASLNGHVVAGDCIVKKHSHLESFVPTINATLERAGFSYQELDRVLVTKGPGSFTGVRIGLATAQAICICTGAKLDTVSTFDVWEYALRQQFASEVRATIVAIEAYAGQLYVKVFDYKAPSEAEPTLICSNQFKEYVSSLTGEKVLCGGSGIHLVYSDIEKIPEFIVLPRKIGVLKLGAFACEIIASGRTSSSPLPMYMKPASVGKAT